MLLAVVVRIERDAVFRGGVQKHLAQRTVKARIGHVQRTALSMECVMKLLVVFRALEQWQHLVVAPTGIAQRCPVVIVPAVAAHIQHGVDGAGATQRLATWLVALATVQAGLGHRLIGVVVECGGHHGHHASRCVDQHTAVGATSL